MENLQIPTRMGFAYIFLFLLNIVALAIGYFTDNAWFILQGILLSGIQYYMHGTIAKEYAK